MSGVCDNSSPARLGKVPNVSAVPNSTTAASAISSRILVVEDNPTTSRTLKLFLDAEGYRVRCALNGSEAAAALAEATFDLILLDLMLPDIDGLSLCRTLRQNSNVPIVMLTARTAQDEIVEGLEAGADDYISKPFGSKELLARIRRCLRAAPTHVGLASSQLRCGELSVDLETREVNLAGQHVRLTRSEFDLLVVLMRRPGRVFTRDQLITLALGAEYEGADRTIDTHVWSLRKKLGEPRSRPGYILSEAGVGYRLRDPDAT